VSDNKVEAVVVEESDLDMKTVEAKTGKLFFIYIYSKKDLYQIFIVNFFFGYRIFTVIFLFYFIKWL
jgi:hypothetical protein